MMLMPSSRADRPVADRRIGMEDRSDVVDPRQATVDHLSAQAKRLAARGEPENAVRRQREAVALCREIFAEYLSEVGQTTAFDDHERHEAAHRLADHYGRLGGLQRRAGQLEPALDSYTHGAEIEREWHLDDSYNRTNKIVLALLVDPGRLPALADEIGQAADLVHSQVERARRDQWWAWADLGLLSLLGGRPHDALWAYDHFAESGARRTDYESTLTVMRELQTRLSGVQPELAAAFTEAIEHLAATCPT
jgi:hypothetical protein